MKTIILTVGIPASGKSTWAVQEMTKHPDRYKRVNKDLLRAMFDNGQWSLAREKFLLDVRDYAVQKALLKGYDVIVDDTNFSEHHWESMCRIAKRVGDVTVVEKFFDISLKEALRRNVLRAERVPDDVIIRMYDKHVKNGRPKCRIEYFDKARYTPPKDVPEKPKAIMVDIDGTLALAENRNVYDGSQVNTDTPYTHIVDLVKLLINAGFALVLMSGRDEKWRSSTLQWIRECTGLPVNGPLYMRKDDDKRPDTVVKRELYEANVYGKYDVRYVIDDRPCVCAMWRDLGLVVLQVDDRPF